MSTEETLRPPQFPRQVQETGETPANQISEKDVTAEEESRQSRPVPTPAAAYLLRERVEFLGWLVGLGASPADADCIHADAMWRAQIYYCPPQVTPKTAAWRHVKFARKDHVRRALREQRQLAELSTHAHMAPTRITTPEDLALLASTGKVAKERIEAAMARGSLSFRVVVEDRVFGEDLAPQQLAAELGIGVNRVYRLRAAARRLVQEILAALDAAE